MLDSFTRAYIAAALWSSNDANYGIEDIAPETLARMVTDCAKFQTVYGYLLTEENCKRSPAIEHAGHDFWLTRNHHGAGFWDGDWKEPAAKVLTDAAHAFGGFDLYVGDDGQIHA